MWVKGGPERCARVSEYATCKEDAVEAMSCNSWGKWYLNTPREKKTVWIQWRPTAVRNGSWIRQERRRRFEFNVVRSCAKWYLNTPRETKTLWIQCRPTAVRNGIWIRHERRRRFEFNVVPQLCAMVSESAMRDEDALNSISSAGARNSIWLPHELSRIPSSQPTSR